MKWIDSHCHVDFKNFNKDRSEVLAAMEQELEFAINVAAEKSSNPKILDMVSTCDNLYGVLGLHPHDAKDMDDGLVQFLEKHLSHPKIVAVGETGLDFYKNHSPRETQKEVFIRQIRIAKKFAKPLVVHSREATSETLEILDREKPEKVVFHCFTGNWEEAKSILDRGYYLSFSGVITFGPKVAYLEEVVKKAPLDRIFVETDAPFLTPVPHRGKRNEPAWVRYVGEKVAEIKKKDPGEIADATGANVKAFFSI